MQRLAPAVPREEHPPFGSVHRLPVWSLPWELHYPFFRGMESALVRDRPTSSTPTRTGPTRSPWHDATAHAAGPRSFSRPTSTRSGRSTVDGSGTGSGIYDRRLAGPVVAAAARVIVQTHEEERLLRSLGLTLPPIEILPPGYSPLPSPPEGAAPFRDRMGIPGPFVLFVGRLASNKGLVDLLLAFAALARDDPAAHLVLVGEDGGMRATLEARTRSLGLEPRVHFLGHLPDDALLTAAYRDAAFTVLPSEYEAFGLVLLESLAEGTPVVASRVGGSPNSSRTSARASSSLPATPRR